MLKDRLVVRNPVGKALSSNLSPMKDSQFSDLPSERTFTAKLTYM